VKKFIIAWLGLVCSLAFAESTPSLQNLLSSFQSFHAHFHEIAGALQAEGELWIQKPGKFYWKASSPNAEIFLSDGEDFYRYEPGLLQAIRSPLSNTLDQTPLLLLSGEITDLSEHYVVEILSPEHFRLKPKDSTQSGGLITSMDLQFQSGKLSSFSLKSQLGQETLVTFSKVEWNPPIPSSLFHFVLPEGADLLAG